MDSPGICLLEPGQSIVKNDMNIRHYTACDVDDEGSLWNDSATVVPVGHFKKGLGCALGADVPPCHEGVPGPTANGPLPAKDQSVIVCWAFAWGICRL